MGDNTTEPLAAFLIHVICECYKALFLVVLLPRRVGLQMSLGRFAKSSIMHVSNSTPSVGRKSLFCRFLVHLSDTPSGLDS